MPSYYRPGTRKRNRYIVVRGRIDGKAYEFSTGTTDPDGAEEFWYAIRRDIRQGDLHRSREAATFDDAARLYEAARDLSKSERRYVKRLKAHFRGKHLSRKDERSGLYVLAFTPADLIDAAHVLYPRCLPQTKNRQAITPAIAILHYAAENRLCDRMVARKLESDEPERPLVYPEDLATVIRAARGALSVILETLAFQGWRITEILTIKRQNFDPANRRVRRWVSKSWRWRWAALDAGVCRSWQRLPKRADGYMFPYRNRHEFYRALGPILDRLGVEYTPRMSRRGFATALLEEGADLKSIMDAGQWEDIKSVLIYADVDVAQARRTIGKLRGRMRGKRRKRLG